MMHKAWISIEEVSYCFSRSSVKFQGHMALKIVKFDPDWAFPDCNSSLNFYRWLRNAAPSLKWHRRGALLFLTATKQLYEWYFLSICLSVCPSVCPSHLFDYVSIIVSSQKFQELLPMTEVMSMQKVKVRGQRSRSQSSQPNLTVSGL